MLFDTHISEMRKKIYGTVMYINRIKDNFNKNSRIAVIQSLVLSVISYGIKVWGTTNVTQKQRVQKLQNFAAKVASGGVIRREHPTPYLKDLEWIKINQIFYYEL